MKKYARIIVIAVMIVGVLVIASCLSSSSNKEAQLRDQMKQNQADIVVLQEEVATLKEQFKNLNEATYRNDKRTEALEEVYDYVAKDDEMPDTGE